MRLNVTRLNDDLDCSLSEYRKARDLLGLLDLDRQRRSLRAMYAKNADEFSESHLSRLKKISDAITEESKRCLGDIEKRFHEIKLRLQEIKYQESALRRMLEESLDLREGESREIAQGNIKVEKTSKLFFKSSDADYKEGINALLKECGVWDECSAVSIMKLRSVIKKNPSRMNRIVDNLERRDSFTFRMQTR